MGINVINHQCAQSTKSLGSDNKLLDGTEQTLLDQPGGQTSELSGYLDLANLVGGDTVVVRLYGKLRQTGTWRMYHEETYNGVQTLPLVYITQKPENHGLRVSIEQIAGSYKEVDYEFFEKC